MPLALIITVALLLDDVHAGDPYFDRTTYCGVNAVYAAAISLKVPVEYNRLIDPEFVDGHGGSSVRGLTSACRAIGLHASAYRGMTTSDLRSIAQPIILHVRGSADSREFNHWVLCLWSDGTTAHFATLGDWPTEMAVYDLGAWWDGIGIVIANNADHLPAVLPHHLSWSMIGLVISAVTAIGLTRSPSAPATRSSSRRRRPISRLIVLFVATGAVALAYECLAGDTLLRSQQAVSDIHRAMTKSCG